MIINNTQKRKKKMTTYRRIAAIGMAIFFVLSLAGIASAAASSTYSTQGQVLSVDTAAKTLTVKTINTTISSPSRFKGDIPFVTNNKTQIAMGKKHETLASLKAGDMVKVVFYEKDGKNIADRIMVTSRHHMAMNVPIGSTDKEMTLKGRVVALDTSHQTKTVTLQSREIGRTVPNSELNIFANDNTRVMVCKESEPLSSVKLGSNATIKYHELGGVALADNIYERC